MASEKGVDLERDESAAPTKQRPGWEEPSLSLSVHDSTRLEWSVRTLGARSQGPDGSMSPGQYRALVPPTNGDNPKDGTLVQSPGL